MRLRIGVVGVLVLSAVHLVGAQPASTPEANTNMVENTGIGHNGLNLNGAVGMPLNPTAQIPDVKGVRVQADYFDLGKAKDADIHEAPSPFITVFSTENHGPDFRFYGLHAAGRPWKAPVEISAGVEKLNVSGTSRDSGGIIPVSFFTTERDFDEMERTGFAAGAKWQFYRSPSGNTFGAAGVGYSRALFNNYNAYIVGTHAFSTGKRSITAHLGVRYDHFKIEGHDRSVFVPIIPITGPTTSTDSFADSSSKVSLYGGLEVPLDKRGHFTLAGEIGTKNASDFEFDNSDNSGLISRFKTSFPYSASLRYQSTHGFSASVGVVRQGVIADSGLFAQAGYSF